MSTTPLTGNSAVSLPHQSISVMEYQDIKQRLTRDNGVTQSRNRVRPQELYTWDRLNLGVLLWSVLGCKHSIFPWFTVVCICLSSICGIWLLKIYIFMQSRCIPPSVYMGIVCDRFIIVWGFGMFSSPWWFRLTISPLMILTLLSACGLVLQLMLENFK